MDEINEIKNPQSFFVTNDKSAIQKGGSHLQHSMSIAEKSLISNIRKGMSLHPVAEKSQIEKTDMLASSQVYGKGYQSKYNVQHLQHPQIDMDKLNLEQQEEIQFYISQIQNLEHEHKQIKTDSIKDFSKQYEKQRKAHESEEFFKEYVKACEKHILKSLVGNIAQIILIIHYYNRKYHS